MPKKPTFIVIRPTALWESLNPPETNNVTTGSERFNNEFLYVTAGIVGPEQHQQCFNDACSEDYSLESTTHESLRLPSDQERTWFTPIEMDNPSTDDPKEVAESWFPNATIIVVDTVTELQKKLCELREKNRPVVSAIKTAGKVIPSEEISLPNQ